MYYVEKTKGVSFFKQFDYYLYSAVLLLTAMGLLLLFSATREMENGDKLFNTQVIGVLIGITLSLIISRLDYKDFKTLGIIFYIFSNILLILVLIFGTVRNGARSWFNFGGVSFQPSELSKIALIIITAFFMERIKNGEKDNGKNIIKLIVYAMIPIGLVLKQPDAGTAMVFMFTLAVLAFVCGLSYKYYLFAIIGAVLSTPIMWFRVLDGYQKKRFLSFLWPERYARDESYHIIQAKTAIGSGGLWGNGYLDGIQTHRGFLPVKESDFIFSVLGEEFGFIVTVIFVLVVFFILFRCIYIAKISRDSFGSFLVIGIVSMFAFHFIENIGMNIGLLPITGIPLPFVSQGSSAMISNYIAVGILMSVSMRRQKELFNSD